MNRGILPIIIVASAALFLSGCVNPSQVINATGFVSDTVFDKAMARVMAVNDEVVETIQAFRKRVEEGQKKLDIAECGLPLGKVNRMALGLDPDDREDAKRILENCAPGLRFLMEPGQ